VDFLKVIASAIEIMLSEIDNLILILSKRIKIENLIWMLSIFIQIFDNIFNKNKLDLAFNNGYLYASGSEQDPSDSGYEAEVEPQSDSAPEDPEEGSDEDSNEDLEEYPEEAQSREDSP
jgi:hypothetical protein